MHAHAGRAIALVLSLTTLVGCTSDGSSSEDSAETDSSPTATPSDDVAPESAPPEGNAAAASPALPELGDCWDVPPGKAFRPDYWYDGSPKVPCSASHTTETVSVYPLERATRTKAELLGPGCFGDALYRVGIDTQHWVPWAPLMYLPSRRQVEAGASWVRCDVAFPADYPGSRPRRHTDPVVDAATARADALWGCLDFDPRRPADQPLVSCSAPHRYESTGTLAVLESLEAYPTPRALLKASQQCRDDLPTSQRREDVQVTAHWDTKAQFDPVNGTVFGTCWFHRADGEKLPPRR